MNVPSELQKYAPNWYSYLTRNADFTKLKTAPNSNINMNKYSYCIVGEGTGKGRIYFDKRFPEYDPELKRFSKLINKQYHALIEDSTQLGKFNDTLKKLIEYLKTNSKKYQV